jgi:hypothetical protein
MMPFPLLFEQPFWPLSISHIHCQTFLPPGLALSLCLRWPASYMLYCAWLGLMMAPLITQRKILEIGFF